MLNNTLVLGIGNPLMQDDGVGVLAIKKLKSEHHGYPNVEFMDGGTLSFALMGEIESVANLIVIDAAQMNTNPGTVKIFLDDEMDAFLGQQKNSSVHDVTLIDLMSIALLSDQLPIRRALIGIQPKSIDWSTEPSLEILGSLTEVCELTMQLVEQWNT